MILYYSLQNKLYLLSVLLILALIVGCSAMRDFEAHMDFIESEVIGSEKIKTEKIRTGEEVVFVASSNNDANERATVIWIHGTPGSWSEIGRHLLEPDGIRWISLDRPGWGESLKPLIGSEMAWQQHRNNYASLSQQVAILKPVVKQLINRAPDHQVILAGFSWGAPLAVAIALEVPEINGLVLFAGGFSSELMSIRWYHYLAKTNLGKWMIGDQLDRSTEEMLALPDSLDWLMTNWRKSERKIPTYVLQGGKDPLVPFENAEWLASELQAQPIKVFIDPDYGHLWHIQRYKVVNECIKAMITSDDRQCRVAIESNRGVVL